MRQVGYESASKIISLDSPLKPVKCRFFFVPEILASVVGVFMMIYFGVRHKNF
jgi:hypothetical protein